MSYKRGMKKGLEIARKKLASSKYKKGESVYVSSLGKIGVVQKVAITSSGLVYYIDCSVIKEAYLSKIGKKRVLI